ncbi:hypothetical protein KEM56_001723 [Ascosphaera pollenicola]|nr:hypothetical protein KEM56_001723 [Ascosphaera pollenicola]
MPPKLSTSVDTSWASGLRGIASLFVVSSHLVMCFARSMLPPNTGMDMPAKFYQLPYIRLLGQGNAWVAVFFVLLGYVNSLKPIQCSRMGKTADALSNLARSSFRRTGRLVFPAAAVTVISWSLCQLGLLELARRSDAFWLQETSPPPSSTWFSAIWDLCKELVGTWMYEKNKYDQPQWALAFLFRGSMYAYLVLLATCNTTGSFRLAVMVALYIWNWISDYNQYAEQRTWSRNLQQIGFRIFPAGANQGRHWPAVGSHILSASILYSSNLRNWLGTPFFTWLGGISFPIYLLHGTLVRTLLTWITFGPRALLNPPSYATIDHTAQNAPPTVPRIAPCGQWATPDLDIIPQPNDLTFIFIIPIFGAILLFVCNMWSIHVEPYFGAATAWCERFATTWRKGGDTELFETVDGPESRRGSRNSGLETIYITPKGSPKGSPRRSLLPLTEKSLRE